MSLLSGVFEIFHVFLKSGVSSELKIIGNNPRYSVIKIDVNRIRIILLSKK